MHAAVKNTQYHVQVSSYRCALYILNCWHGWGSHPGKSGHSLTNILTLHTRLSTFIEQKYAIPYACMHAACMHVGL